MEGCKLKVTLPLDTALGMAFIDSKTPVDVRFYDVANKKFDIANISKLHVVEKVDPRWSVGQGMLEMMKPSSNISALVWQYETGTVCVLLRNNASPITNRSNGNFPYVLFNVNENAFGECDLPDVFYAEHFSHLRDTIVTQMLFTRILETPPNTSNSLGVSNSLNVLNTSNSDISNTLNTSNALNVTNQSNSEVVPVVSKGRITQALKKQKTLRLINPLPDILKPTDL